MIIWEDDFLDDGIVMIVLTMISRIFMNSMMTSMIEIFTQVLEEELHLPFSLVSGHIHELQVGYIIFV